MTPLRRLTRYYLAGAVLFLFLDLFGWESARAFVLFWLGAAIASEIANAAVAQWWRLFTDILAELKRTTESEVP